MSNIDTAKENFTPNEKFYDDEIAPVLLELSNKCKKRDMAFLSAVEYELGYRGLTSNVPEDAGLEMIMLRLCANAGANVDAYIIALLKYMKNNSVDFRNSLIFKALDDTLTK